MRKQPLPVRARMADGGTAGRRVPSAPVHPDGGAGGVVGGSGSNRDTSVALGSPSRLLAVSPSAASGEDAARSAALWQALGDVLDPEFPISIVDLGLVYGVRAAAGVVEVDLTFTATGCPCMDFIREDVRERLGREPGVREVRIREVWDPPWTPARISDEGRSILRRHGVAA